MNARHSHILWTLGEKLIKCLIFQDYPVQRLYIVNVWIMQVLTFWVVETYITIHVNVIKSVQCTGIIQ